MGVLRSHRLKTSHRLKQITPNGNIRIYTYLDRIIIESYTQHLTHGYSTIHAQITIYYEDPQLFEAIENCEQLLSKIQ